MKYELPKTYSPFTSALDKRDNIIYMDTLQKLTEIITQKNPGTGPDITLEDVLLTCSEKEKKFLCDTIIRDHTNDCPCDFKWELGAPLHKQNLVVHEFLFSLLPTPQNTL